MAVALFGCAEELRVWRGRHIRAGRSGSEKQGDETGPAGLVRGAEPAPGVTVKIFVEQQMVAKGEVRPVTRRVAKDRTPSVSVLEEQTRETA